jgi:hypothetical protein
MFPMVTASEQIEVVTAIEAEAVRDVLAKVRREVEGLDCAPCVGFDYAVVVDRAAVLAILDGAASEGEKP